MSASDYNFKHAKDLPDIGKKLPKGEINVGLIIDKYSLWKQNREGVEETKIDFIVNVLNNSQKKKKISSKIFPLNVYSNYFTRHKDILNNLSNEGYCVNSFEAKLQWRLAINLGEESIYETSISLHRNYSIPIIPGSAIKGCARAWANYNDLKGENNREIQTIFGSPLAQGNTIFFDALPVINDKTADFITKDIINTHYPDYYRDVTHQTPPGDWMDPNPVIFLDVEKIAFEFTIASKQKDSLEVASKFLKGGLTELGIGAKTSAGYGYFMIVNQK